MSAKVALTKCASYRPSEVRMSLRMLLGHLGGLERFVEKGNTVLLKPNLLSARPPESGIDTHPEVVRQMVLLLEEIGCHVLVGDNPGGKLEHAEKVWQESGMREAVKGTRAELVRFNDIEEFAVVDSRVLPRIALASLINEVDFVISIPKFKTHGLTLLTGAVKNFFGLIPGFLKGEVHKTAPHAREFGQAVADIYSLIPPHLSLMDGVIAMEGDGPVSDDLRPLGLLLASEDSVSLDTVMAALIGLLPSAVPIITACMERGLGEGIIDNINVLGENWEMVCCSDFRLPHSSIVEKIPRSVARFLAKRIIVRPKVYREKCNGCGTCRKKCPVEAISIPDRYPHINYHKCISCLCCYEFCPEGALKLNKSLLARLRM